MLYNRKSQRIKDTLGFSIWFTTINTSVIFYRKIYNTSVNY